MTVEELIKALNKYPKDSQVAFTLPGAKHLFCTDKLWADSMNRVVLECDDAVDFEDVVGMAEQCWTENEDFMSYERGEILRDFTVAAEEDIENEGQVARNALLGLCE